MLETRFQGVFPSEYVLRRIDGCQEFAEEGTREMPIWGNIWRPEDERPFEDEVAAQRTFTSLLHYLESIQQQPEV
jgi:hypothetical protein